MKQKPDASFSATKVLYKWQGCIIALLNGLYQVRAAHLIHASLAGILALNTPKRLPLFQPGLFSVNPSDFIGS